jgi:hypothetical protein
MSVPQENARQDDAAETAQVEDETESTTTERSSPRQDTGEDSTLEGAPRGDPTP